MTSILSINDIANYKQHPECVVAYIENKACHFSSFQKDVDVQQTNFSNVKSSAVALFHQDSYQFLVNFFALYRLGKTILLPQNGASETLKDYLLQGIAICVDGEIQTPEIEEVYSYDEQTLVFYTSGSTGNPKAVEKAFWQLDAEILCQHTQWYEIRKNDVVLSTVSHQHIYGLIFKLLWPICAGHSFVNEQIHFWEELLIHDFDRSILISSPAHLSRYPQGFCLPKENKIKGIFSSGGPLRYEDAQRSFDILGALPIEVYGSTETGGIAYRQQIETDTAWTAFSGIKISTHHDALLINSPFLPEAYQTNDCVSIFQDGRFILKGRNDRIIKIEGKRLSLPELEYALMDEDIVRDAVCLRLEDDRQSLVAIVVLTSYGLKVMEEMGKYQLGLEMKKRLNGRFERVTLPRKWRFVDEIPVNSQGKRNIKQLRDLFD
ncbi:AMP-binding protein [Curvivirga aplysinae]|uniref:AMP-binding protein n=1 Tax=Curvivirga aplysinae TaxID=2529852 RepID=UPI0012BC718A|nr:AMP-binding protein [Curvivirga aplysinae]MTI11032.1 AMP-fatty acid ligase [Curvivirga aplysinae]